jgi:hypothetical protein
MKMSQKLNKTYSNWALPLILLSAAPVQASPAYDQLYPYYVQFCAVTQLKPLDGQNGGGTGGHGVLFMKGVCRDTSASYPRLKLCGEGSIDLSNPESGTSISVDQIFQNANWMASDGKSLLITANLSEAQRLDQATQDGIIHQVQALDLFKGIKIHPQYMKDKPKSMSNDEYVVRTTLATEFGLNLGRNVYCSRIPVERKMLQPMVDYLNSLNDFYQKNNDYEWSGVFNNCTHTTHNAIAAPGLLRPYATDKNIAQQAFNLAIPGNEYIDLESQGNDEDLNDVVAFYLDPYKRKALLEQDWMMTQPGVLTDNHRMHQNNALYDTNSDFFVLSVPGLSPKRADFNRINREARYSDIVENLRYFKTKYENALSSRLSIEELDEIQQARATGSAIQPPKLRSKEFASFYNAYYEKIERSLKDVEKKLQLLLTPH